MSWLLQIVNFRVHIHFLIMVYPYMCPSGIAVSDGSSILIFKGTFILAVPNYIPASNVGEIPFLHTLSSIYCL